MRIVVFAYSQLGHDCLKYLIDNKENVVAVFTHDDNPNEHIWFDSVASLAALHNIETIRSPHPNTEFFIKMIREKQPDIIFSFYYRNMICQEILDIPTLGAMNMHGSLLPKYRGRVPINWAIIHGEKQSGATLHYMVKAPDAGDIVDQESVSILPNDTAGQVMDKVIDVAVKILARQLPLIKKGKNPRIVQDHSLATYYSGRKPEDGCINWVDSSVNIHNLVRALLPYPKYPCAYFMKGEEKIRVAFSEVLNDEEPCDIGSIVKENQKDLIVACGESGKERIWIRPFDLH